MENQLYLLIKEGTYNKFIITCTYHGPGKHYAKCLTDNSHLILGGKTTCFCVYVPFGKEVITYNLISPQTSGSSLASQNFLY